MDEGKEDGNGGSGGVSYGDSRGDLLAKLNDIVELAHGKALNKRVRRGDRLSWSRILVSACNAAGNIIKDGQLDELELRVRRLEEGSRR